MIVYDSHWLTIRWDESLKATHFEVKGYAESEEFRAGMGQLLALCQRKRNSRYLADTRLMAAVTQSDQRWVNEVYVPAMIAAGVRYQAVIMPKSAVARLSAKYVLAKINEVTLTTNYFDDVETARAWLRTC
ncbi:MAG: STAS/SEC14 domain-containing protein [Polyangia bacterium]